MFAQPNDERRREQLAQHDLVLVAAGPELEPLHEGDRLELHLVEVVAGEPVRATLEAVDDAAPAPQVDALEARHAVLADVDSGNREVVRLPSVRLVAVVLPDLERVPAEAATIRFHPVLAAATVAAAEERRELGEAPLRPVVQPVHCGVATEELVLSIAV